MIMNQDTFESLIAEALQQDFSGWDFSYLQGRWHGNNPSWDYRQIVFDRSRQIHSLLDLGTGGVEVLSILIPFWLLLYIVYVIRDDIIHIVSARLVTNAEREIYENQ